MLELNFQKRVRKWMDKAFGPASGADIHERMSRGMEEYLELAQAVGFPKEDVYKLIEYTYGRPVGEVRQELGGVKVTTAAIATALGEDFDMCGEIELSRCWDKIETIRAKQANKPFGSPLPGKAPEDDA